MVSKALANVVKLQLLQEQVKSASTLHLEGDGQNNISSVSMHFGLVLQN